MIVELYCKIAVYLNGNRLDNKQFVICYYTLKFEKKKTI